MNFIHEIERIIESNGRTYKDSSDRFIADYNRELELTKEYNGRQLLELLQNADDAGSKEVLIDWNKGSRSLSISNQGEPFTSEGIKSLMLANLSTKTKVSYIGNKGLGFRAILNWAEEIRIASNGAIVSFSEGIAKDYFENKLGLDPEQKNAIRQKRDLSDNTVPFPVLAMPVVEKADGQSQWATTIELSYRKEFEADIAGQIADLTEEILLFLNSVTEITIRVDAQITRLKSNRQFKQDYELISIRSKAWKVFKREKILPDAYQDKSKNEKQFYGLKIAVQDDLSDSYGKLFNFFPTQLTISLPCIIHGTFELNSSRNHLNESKKNEYILGQLVGLFKDCAAYLERERVDWRPYRLLTPLFLGSDSKLIVNFYWQLEALKRNEAVYPCISGEYHDIDNAVYYNDEFNSFFQQYFSDTLPDLIIPLNGEVENRFKQNTYSHEFLVERIDNLAKRENLPLDLRAQLIIELAKVIPFDEHQEKFSLLVNETDEIIPKEDLAFTPMLRSEEQLVIPKSVKLDFMKSGLFDILNERLKGGYDKQEPPARELQRSIKSIVNLQPYDSNNVVDKIVTGTKDALKYIQEEEERLRCVKEMIVALFVNYKNIDVRQERLRLSVPLISLAEKIEDAGELFLSKSYPSGKTTEEIYGNLLRAEDYLEDIEYLGLKEEDNVIAENFLLWLGVNKFSKLRRIQLRDNSAQPYLDFLFDQDCEIPEDFSIGRISKDCLVTSISNFEIIRKLDLNHIILLALKDASIRRNLEQNDEIVQWQYNYPRSLSSQYSYIRYQFISANIFTRFLLEDGSEDLNRLVNDNFTIDYSFFERNGINKADVRSILIKLGAKESFDEISAEDIYDILRRIPEKDENRTGRLTQTVYKLALESLLKQNSMTPPPADLLLFSKKGNSSDYRKSSQIYYSDNSILPQKILAGLPLLNLPKRVGEDNVEQFLGVKSLKGFKIELDSDRLRLNPIDSDFGKVFEIIKPYLLAYRLESPILKKRINDPDTKRREARLIKQCTIHISEQCYFDFGDKKGISVDEKEFINIGDCYYFKDASAHSVDQLKRDSIFCDAFAEMMCIAFKVNDLKNDFRQIFKNDLSDTIHLATHDLGRPAIEEAFSLLGISRAEIGFWRNIFLSVGKKLIEPIENADVLRATIKEKLFIDLPDGYLEVDFENFDNNASLELIKLLCSEPLQLPVKKVVPQGLCSLHRLQFSNALKDIEFTFKALLWERLNVDSVKQKDFIALLNHYNLNYLQEIEDVIQKVKFELEPDYSALIIDRLSSDFNIDFGFPLPTDIDIKNRYRIVLSKYDIEEVDLPIEVRSLLFFDGNKDEIEVYLQGHCDTKNGAADGDLANQDAIGTIVYTSINKNVIIPTVSGGKGNGTWVHSPSGEKGKTRKGKGAEYLVFKTLVSHYGISNVKWVSGNSTTPDKNDSLHYDIQYKNEDGAWKNVEVKSISESRFVISSAEVNKGLSDPRNYEIALVFGSTIYMVKEIFSFAVGESFENNSKFIAHPKDYIFSFDIESLTGVAGEQTVAQNMA